MNYIKYMLIYFGEEIKILEEFSLRDYSDKEALKKARDSYHEIEDSVYRCKCRVVKTVYG